MGVVVVERQFEVPQHFEELQALEDAVQWCLDTHEVRALYSLFSLDRRRAVCVYKAPDAEAVRQVQRSSGLPVSRLWPAEALLDGPAEAPAGFSLVLAQRDLQGRFSREQALHSLTDPTGCGERHRMTHLRALLARDLSRMICVYACPDVETVRVVSREAGLPLERAFSCEELSPGTT